MRQALIGDRPGPDQRAVIPRQNAPPVRPDFPIGNGGVVNIGDIASLIGIDEIGGGHIHPGEDGLPFLQRFRLVQPVIGVKLAEPVDPAITDGEGAISVLDHRPMRAAIDGAADGQNDRANPHGQGDAALLQIAPLPIQPVTLAAVIQHQFVYVDHVRGIDRIGPPQILIMAEEGVGGTGEIRPGIMPALVAFHDQFIPCHTAAPGLVAVGNQHGGSTRFLRRNGKGVGTGHGAILAKRRERNLLPLLLILHNRGMRPAGIPRNIRPMFGMQFFACHQRLNHIVQGEEERLAQGKSGGHILAVNRKEIAQLYFFRMGGSIVIQPGRIGFKQGAGIGGQFGIVPLRRPARIQQVIDIIHRRPILTRYRAIATARHGQHILQGEEIILSMGCCHAIGDIGISLAVNMRHAEFIARDTGGIGDVRNRLRAIAGPQRFPRCQRDKGHHRDQQKHSANPRQPFQHEPASSQRHGLAGQGAGCNRAGQNLAPALSLGTGGGLAMPACQPASPSATNRPASRSSSI